MKNCQQEALREATGLLMCECGRAWGRNHPSILIVIFHRTHPTQLLQLLLFPDWCLRARLVFTSANFKQVQARHQHYLHSTKQVRYDSQ